MKRCLLLITMILALASCSNGSWTQPIEVPSLAIDEAQQQAEQDPLFQSVDWVSEDWWTLFNDEQLADFIGKTFANNPSLQAARATIHLAANRADLVRAALFPSLDWGADVSREKLSETGIIPFNTKGTTVGQAPMPVTAGTNGIPVYFTQYETELILNFDFDIWCKNRNAWRAALSDVQARIADEAFRELQLGIAVASVYFQLQIDYEREEILKALVKNRTDYLDYIRKRKHNNLESALTINSAESDLAQAKQALLVIQGDIAVNEYQLKTYIAGTFEEPIFNTSIGKQPLPKVPMPKEIPLHLVAHRPDIIAQLWTITSAGRQIEVAKAGFYPDFNIMALFGFQTLHLHELFKWPSSYYNVDPAFTLPIFDGGRLAANLRSSEINYDLAILGYNDKVLNAVNEVLSALAVLRNADQQLKTLTMRTISQEENFKLTSLRVSRNLNSRLDYLASEETMLNAKDQETVVLGNTLQAILMLIKALGGGYYSC